MAKIADADPGGCASRARPARHHAHLPRLAARSRDAHVDEQPRPRSSRETGRADHLRRTRQSRAKLGLLSRHRKIAERTKLGRNSARAIRQASRDFPHARICAASPDRQFQSSRTLEQLGAIRRTRSRRPDDVRPDDRRKLDLYRHARNSAGHLRNFRRRGTQTFWRRSGRKVGRQRRHGRHGRRATARGHFEWRGISGHRCRSASASSAA